MTHCTHPREILARGPDRYQHLCQVSGQCGTSREVRLNPRALGTSPRAMAPPDGTDKRARVQRLVTRMARASHGGSARRVHTLKK
jgi:hypothetical protein